MADIVLAADGLRRVVRRSVGAGFYVRSTVPIPAPVLTEVERAREDATLDHLAAETALTDPWTAAQRLFGGDQ